MAEKTLSALFLRTVEDVIEIGLALKRVKAILGHGQFGGWLKTEFGMSERSALRFMQVATRFSAKSARLADLRPEALYELAAPSTPDEVIAAVEAKVAAGELVTAAEVKRLRDEAKAKAEEAQRAAARAEAAEDQLTLLQQQDVEREARIRREAEEKAKDSAECEIRKFSRVVVALGTAPTRPERGRPAHRRLARGRKGSVHVAHRIEVLLSAHAPTHRVRRPFWLCNPRRRQQFVRIEFSRSRK